MDKRTFIIEELMLPGFIEKQDRHMVLLETIDSGKSKLVFSLTSDKNLLIENVDLKKTEFQFFVKDKGVCGGGNRSGRRTNGIVEDFR